MYCACSTPLLCDADDVNDNPLLRFVRVSQSFSNCSCSSYAAVTNQTHTRSYTYKTTHVGKWIGRQQWKTKMDFIVFFARAKCIVIGVGLGCTHDTLIHIQTDEPDADVNTKCQTLRNIVCRYLHTSMLSICVSNERKSWVHSFIHFTFCNVISVNRTQRIWEIAFCGSYLQLFGISSFPLLCETTTKKLNGENLIVCWKTFSDCIAISE